MATHRVQDAFVYIVFSLTVLVNVICLYLLWSRKDKQPLKSRSPLWLGIGLVVGQIQVSTILFGIVEKIECHVQGVTSYMAYSGYIMCLIVRCWKLHFAFNINKSKLLKTDYKSWFQRRKFFVSEQFLIPSYTAFIIILCLIGILFAAIDAPVSWKPEFGDCKNPWVSDMLTNTFIFLACVITLIVFCVILHHIDDGFSVSKELRISITLILGSWGIYFAFLFGGGNLFQDGGPFQPEWFVILAMIGSSGVSVYYPIYLTHTKKWMDTQNTPRPVSMNELKDVNHFLNTPSGIEPFLRFLHCEFSAELLFLWRDIEEFTKEEDNIDRKNKAKTILEDYLDPDGNKHMPESEEFRYNIKNALEQADIPPTMFNELKFEVEKRLRGKFNRFILSNSYKQYACGVTIKESLMELGLN